MEREGGERMKVSLKAMRVNANLKQTEVARQLGISTLTLQSWENDKTSPKVNQLMKLCEIYGCTLDDIFLSKKLV